ncbi:ergothioneine biosynthesis glutamate--cysteine ligase EgtA [Williamsia deligens]|uniref:Glutamate--cysteine ligase EgtA n=1 Tax=Williamsia deligens TaxID=321325 RepID=A0ABW3G9M1_9NOCA|nr:ergothioneine biosynthesis glutamate--cysteine ligase EgtA [Williamsia deligens]MCP2193677.1 glutamate--cysteine ligase [Williamsia deligens]
MTTTTSSAITSRPAAAAHLTRVCFKLGPPRLVGAELEWFTRTTDRHRPSGRPDVPRLAAALGDHAPRTITPASPALPLNSGSLVSVEPGGQIELSSTPFDSVDELGSALAADERDLRALLAAADIEVVAGAADGVRPPHRILVSDRYRSMEDAFARRGIFGSLMMCNTAAVQVALDAGVDADHAVSRWTRLHTIGPAMTAAFANSPRLHGADDERWASQRMRAWLGTDRTRIPPHAQTIEDYADWVLSVPLLCVRCADDHWFTPPAGATFADWMDGALDSEVGRRPDETDLAYHVTTVFPMVRPQGYLEVRYLDGQPENLWRVPIAAVAALMSDDAVGAEADAIAAPTADAWLRAAQCGLDDAEVRGVAADLLTLAADVTPAGIDRDLVAAAAARCRRGEPPVAQSEPPVAQSDPTLSQSHRQESVSR